MAVTDIDKMLFYRRSDDTDLLSLDSPTTQIAAGQSGAAAYVAATAIGFTFTFDGTDYTTTDVAVNGYLCLNNAGAASSQANAELFTSSLRRAVAPWWDTLETQATTGYVKTELQGTAPWRRFVAEWLCYSSSADDATNNDLLRFQCVLYETTNRIEFRYAARVRTGTPTAATASVGVRGATNVVADNYRDLSVDNRTLGGSNTTTEQALDASDYDALVAGGAIIIEPNWPMCGRYVPVDASQLTGLQHPYGEPIWAIANNVNWLMCKHSPPLVCWAPHTDGAYSGVMYYVMPVTPSVDGLTYRVYLTTYSSAGGNLAATIDEDAAADPQPTTGGDWSNLSSPTATGTSTGYHDWTSFTVAIDAATEYLRITLTPTSGSMYLAHVLIVPEQLADLDETATPASCALPMAIGQLRQRGAAVHPEWYNRAWQTVARVLNDRRQCVWSYGRSNHADAGHAQSDGGRAARTLAISPASIRGWRGVTAEAVIYAWNDADGARVWLQERAGAAVEWTVDLNGSEYRRQSSSIVLVSEEPLLVLSSDLALTTELRISYCAVTWVPGWDDGELFVGATPAPSLEKLVSLVNRVARACTMPYVMTGHATPLERTVGGGTSVVLRWQVPIATKALRPKIVRVSNDIDAVADPTSIVGASSGATGNDIVYVPSPFARGAEEYPWDARGGDIQIASGGETWDASPTAAGDRLLESPTDDVLTGALTEKLTVTFGAGMCLVAYPADPAGI